MTTENIFNITKAILDISAMNKIMYRKETDDTIQKILKTKNEKQMIELYNAIIKQSGNFFSKVDTGILLAFIQSQILPPNLMLNILKNLGNVFSLFVLTIPFKEENLSVLEYAVQTVDSMPLMLMDRCVDISKFQDEAIDLLIPSIYDEIPSFDKGLCLLERTSRDDIVLKMLQNINLSQNALKIICSNTHLKDSTRELAFQSIEDITIISNSTDNMKNSIYDACAETLFYQDTDEIPVEYKEMADKCMLKMTESPSVLMTKKLEKNLTARWGMKDSKAFSPYIENLIKYSKTSSTLKLINAISMNAKISTLSAIKIDMVEVEDIFNLTLNKIITQIKEHKPIDETDIWTLKQITSYSTKHKFINHQNLNNLITTCNNVQDDIFELITPLMIIALDNYLDKELLDEIKSKSRNSLVEVLVNLNLTLKKSNLSQQEQFQIVDALKSLIIDDEDVFKYFNEKTVVTSIGFTTFTDVVEVIDGAFRFSKMTKSDYINIKKALKNIKFYKLCLGTLKIESGIKEIERELYLAHIAYKANKSVLFWKRSDYFILDMFSDLYNKFLLCKNDVDFYDITHKNGKRFITLFNEIQKRIDGGYIVRAMIPHHMQQLFSNLTNDA